MNPSIGASTVSVSARVAPQHRLHGVLPVPADRVALVEGQQAAPVVDGGPDLLTRPVLLAGHQVHVELVAVGAEVDLVEGVTLDRSEMEPHPAAPGWGRGAYVTPA